MTAAAAQGTRGDWRAHHGITAPTGWTPEQYASYADWLLSFQLRPWDWVCECYPWMEEGSSLTIPEVWQRSWLMTLQADLQSQGTVNGNQVIRMAVAAGRGVGKAQPHSLLIDTPTGRRAFGSLAVGDTVFGSDGRPTRVSGVFEQGVKRVFRVHFSDGSSTECCPEHLWNVQNSRDRKKGAWQTRALQELMAIGIKKGQSNPESRWSIPMPKPLEYPYQWVPVDPYTLGAWLGDGSRLTAQISGNDLEIPERIRQGGYKVRTKQTRTSLAHVVAELQQGLRHAGVWTQGSHTKVIPEAYLFNLPEVRRELLRGLLDTDGTVTATGCMQFDSVSEKMATQVAWIARSLGGIARLAKVVRRSGTSWRVTMTMPEGRWFYVQRKQDRVRHTTQKRYLTRYITKVEEIDRAPCRCIMVDADDHLYVANDGIVTHNTALVAWAIHWFMSVFPNGTAVITAGTAAQLETKTWRELLKWQSLACNGWMFEWTATRYRQREAANQWYAAAIPWSDNNPQAFAGTHEKYVLILFDEASAISPLIWEMVEGALSTGLCFFFTFGNPSEGSGGFWAAFNGHGANRWHHFRVDAREVSFANKEEIQGWIDTWGADSDQVRIHVLGMFPRQAATSFIDGKIVQQAAARVIEWRDIPRAIPRVMGVDIARQGMDLNVIVRRQGRKVAPDIQSWHERDTMATANFIARSINEWRPDRVFIDGVGVGAGVVDYLKASGFSRIVVDVQSGQRPTLPDEAKRCANMRAVMWSRMREWLRTADLPMDQELMEELTAPKYKFERKTDRMLVESKAEMLLRGVKSPNKADALVYTFWESMPSLAGGSGYAEPDEV